MGCRVNRSPFPAVRERGLIGGWGGGVIGLKKSKGLKTSPPSAGPQVLFRQGPRPNALTQPACSEMASFLFAFLINQ